MFNYLRTLFVVIKVGIIYYFFKDSKKFAQTLCSSLEKMGPTFVKLGQMLSTRPDILGAELVEALSSLRDQVTPDYTLDIVKVIEAELESPVARHFIKLSLEIVASASIAQIYKATHITGQEVAIKALRPGIEKRVNQDLKMLFLLARIVDSLFPKLKRLRLKDTVEFLRRRYITETDLRLEAANASEFRENNKSAFIYIPKVYWQQTSQRIMTIEWIEGVAISEKEKIKDPKLVAETLLRAFCDHVYFWQFFHADLHPGNILIDKFNRIVFIDFGIVGRINPKTTAFTMKALEGFLKRDYRLVADAHFTAGYVKDHYEDFITACRSIGEPVAGRPLKEISIAKLLNQLFKVTQDFKMKAQLDLLLLQKSLLFLENNCKNLDPEINMFLVIKKWARDRDLMSKSILKAASADLKDLQLTIKKAYNVFKKNLDNKPKKIKTINNWYSYLTPLLLTIIIGLLISQNIR